MADTKLTDLTEATDTTGAVVYGVQGGVDKKIPASLFGGGGWTLTDTITPTSVNTITVDISGYDDIAIVIDGIEHTTGTVYPQVKASTDSGSSYDKFMNSGAGASAGNPFYGTVFLTKRDYTILGMGYQRFIAEYSAAISLIIAQGTSIDLDNVQIGWSLFSFFADGVGEIRVYGR